MPLLTVLEVGSQRIWFLSGPRGLTFYFGFISTSQIVNSEVVESMSVIQDLLMEQFWV